MKIFYFKTNLVLFIKLLEDRDFYREFLQNHGVLPKSVLCPKCGEVCRLEYSHTFKFSYNITKLCIHFVTKDNNYHLNLFRYEKKRGIFRCDKGPRINRCNFQISERRGTFVESKLNNVNNHI